MTDSTAFRLVAGNTFMSPYVQLPLRLGGDTEVHSTPRRLGGQSDAIGGAGALFDPVLYEEVRFAQNTAGAVPGPLDCWLVIRGI